MKQVKAIFCLAGCLLAHAQAHGQSSPVYAWRNFVGSPGQTGTNDDTGAAARFYSPVGVAADKAGNVYVADYLNSTIRMVTSAGVVSTLAGRAGFPGTNDGTGTGARFSNPTGLALDAAGNIYVADSPHIRKVTAAGVVTTLPTAFMALGIPTGLAVDSATNIYVTDQGDDTILKVSTNGAVTVLAGSTGHFGTNDDGTNKSVLISSPATNQYFRLIGN